VSDGDERTAEAIALHERTLADRERLLGTDHPDTLRARNNLAAAYRVTGIPGGQGAQVGGHSGQVTAEAIALLERALADCERLLGDSHPNTLASRNNLAAAYREAGRTAEAITLLERALADCERLLGTEHPTTNIMRGNLAALRLR
jgi:tetratricopeptide (TPR) repeat protein